MTVTKKRSNAPTDLDLQVSARVRSLRVRSGLRQSDVAEALGIVHQQYNKYENGHNRITAGMLIQLANILDCKTSDLFPPRLRGSEELETAMKIDLVRQELIDFIINCTDEKRLAALQHLLFD
ncbi:MAG: helix-turn-helix transcriptional regulator [Pseudomonadota bacterium]